MKGFKCLKSLQCLQGFKFIAYKYDNNIYSSRGSRGRRPLDHWPIQWAGKIEQSHQRRLERH